jgi:hypothetical protein
VRIKVISPNELDPASVKPNGAETSIYLFTNSSDKRKEKTSDILNLSSKNRLGALQNLKQSLIITHIYNYFKRKR